MIIIKIIKNSSSQERE